MHLPRPRPRPPLRRHSSSHAPRRPGLGYQRRGWGCADARVYGDISLRPGGLCAVYAAACWVGCWVGRAYGVVFHGNVYLCSEVDGRTLRVKGLKGGVWVWERVYGGFVVTTPLGRCGGEVEDSKKARLLWNHTIGLDYVYITSHHIATRLFGE
ncbi:hypothetical protein M501DRAFT_657970 [Patellaria atrata CBS 101060]|uniref:Uncharacterized protein n=1 Tax=Patellaria atrata CBS 101060 TaxID=1346257 RepID=A0A9P4SG44_9PEZI|nr:hypothetical protein M501DRAFT_657970 [Patellaria atrata CBS 101060]